MSFLLASQIFGIIAAISAAIYYERSANKVTLEINEKEEKQAEIEGKKKAIVMPHAGLINNFQRTGKLRLEDKQWIASITAGTLSLFVAAKFLLDKILANTQPAGLLQ